MRLRIGCGLAAATPRRRGTARLRRAGAASPTGRCAAAAARRCASSRSSDSARCAPRLVGTSAWISSMMIVSTDAQRLARVRRQQQVERLRRRDEDVGRLALEPRALGLRRVAGADRDRRRDVGVAAAVGDLGDAGERRAQVALDVDRERLERRDVEHAAAAALGRRRREHQAIEAPEKRGQRLAAAGRREDQRRVAARDRRPAERLRPRRRLERRP